MTRRRSRRRLLEHQGPFEHLGRDDDLLVLTGPGVDAAALLHEGLPDSAEVHALSSPVPPPRERGAVVLVVHDLVGLRRAVTGLANFGRARRVGVWFTRDVAQLPVVATSLRWPTVEEMYASRSPRPYVLIGFASSTAVRPIFVELARVAAQSGRLAVGWPNLGLVRGDSVRWPPADPSAKVALASRVLDQSVDSPPDLLLASRDVLEGADHPDTEHPVLGRPTRVAVVEPELSWDELDAMSPGEAQRALVERGASSLGAVDEHVLNPIGFADVATGETARLGAARGGRLGIARRRARTPDRDRLRDGSERRGPAGPARARGGRPRLVRWPRPAGLLPRRRRARRRRGCPLVAERVPDWARSLLAPAVVDALDRPVDLGDRLRREEHSVVLRRAALRHHASGPPGVGAWPRPTTCRPIPDRPCPCSS